MGFEFILTGILLFSSIILYFLYREHRSEKERLEKENENIREELLRLRNENNNYYKKDKEWLLCCVHLAVQYTQTKVPWIAKYKSEELTDIIVEYLSYAKISEPKDVVLEGFDSKIHIALCASLGWLDTYQNALSTRLFRIEPYLMGDDWVPKHIYLTDEEIDMLCKNEYDFILDSLPAQIPPEWIEKEPSVTATEN